MQWADLRGLSSSTRRVARMTTTTATRRQLPLLLPLLRTPVSSSRWSGGNNRAFWTGPRALAGDKGKRNKKKDNSPSIFEEIFPDEDTSSFPYRRRPDNEYQISRQPTRDDKKNEPVDNDADKVRFVTSIHVDKSEASVYRAAQKAAKKEAYFNKKQQAISQIPDLLLPTPKGDWGKSGQVASKKEGPSLFDELFKSEDPPKIAKDGEQVVESRSVNHRDLQAWIDSLVKEDGVSETDRERPAMLILSNASTNLSESDFYRVGPQGQHLDGWSASISKVMQAYDYNSLQPLGRYFILFDSHAAAASYQKEAQRRHSLARRAQQSSVLGPAQPNADQVFTLLPPTRAPLSLHLYKVNKATEARLETFSIQGLLSMTPDPPPRACSQVILSLEGGTLDQRSLSQWIRRDARERNLGWPVQHLRPYFPPKVDQKRAAFADETEDAPENYEWDEDTAPTIVPSQGVKDSLDDTARSALFVLSFPDVHEARRFVRAWHRKELVRPRGQNVLVSTHLVW
nr:uncharacterized protein CTRU02_01361 [Colletotrichum truncatum]KAF6799682.1 hypothetical protein CTRU02_01361 [Colletotrichum truncatum]